PPSPSATPSATAGRGMAAPAGGQVVRRTLGDCSGNVELSVAGDGQVTVTGRGGGNGLALTLDTPDNAYGAGGTQLYWPQRPNKTYTLQPPAPSIGLRVTVVVAGSAATAHFTVTDECGSWPTLAGAGAGAPFPTATPLPQALLPL